MVVAPSPARRACSALVPAGVDGGHRGLPPVQHDGRIPLCDKGIHPGEDLQLRGHRAVGAQRVHRAVGAAQHQLAIGAAGDRGEVGRLLAVDVDAGRRAGGDVEPEVAAARRQVHPAVVVARHRRRGAGQRHGPGGARDRNGGEVRLATRPGVQHHQRARVAASKTAARAWRPAAARLRAARRSPGETRPPERARSSAAVCRPGSTSTTRPSAPTPEPRHHEPADLRVLATAAKGSSRYVRMEPRSNSQSMHAPDELTASAPRAARTSGMVRA